MCECAIDHGRRSPQLFCSDRNKCNLLRLLGTQKQKNMHSVRSMHTRIRRYCAETYRMLIVVGGDLCVCAQKRCAGPRFLLSDEEESTLQETRDRGKNRKESNTVIVTEKGVCDCLFWKNVFLNNTSDGEGTHICAPAHLPSVMLMESTSQQQSWVAPSFVCLSPYSTVFGKKAKVEQVNSYFQRE